MSRILTVLCLASVVGMWQADTSPMNPVGTWSFATTTEDGTPTTGTIEVTGQPGAYSGRIMTSAGRELPLTDVLTSRDAVAMFTELPDGGGTAVIRIVRSAGGTLTGSWGPLRPLLTAKVERAKHP